MGDKEKSVFSIFLSLGSNLGDREKNIEKAYKKIEKQIGEIKSSSAFFYSSPVGFISNNDFVNAVCEVLTKMDIYSTFAATQLIEKEIGRVDKSINDHYSDRVIDIDIILAGELVINTPQLTIPHPKFHERNFVLSPLCEIAPDVIHPILKKSIREIKNELNEKFI